jgi:hypothetical protein
MANHLQRAPNFPPYKVARVADLIPYARNSRTHSDEQVAQIAPLAKPYPKRAKEQAGGHPSPLGGVTPTRTLQQQGQPE